MKVLFRCLGLLLLSPCGALTAETLTIATYNVENYGAADRMTEAGYRRDYPKPEVQKAALRQVLRAIDVDVLVLQEVGGEDYLEELQRDLKAEGLDYPHAAVVEADDPDRHVALLAKRPWTTLTPHAALAFEYFGASTRVKRGLLEVRFATSGGEITVFGLHLKSRYTDRADDPRSALRRMSEATAIRDAIWRRFPEPATEAFVIVGDFNDDKASKPVQRITTRGKRELAELLPAADSRGETWTHAFRKEDSYARVDHVLVSAALRDVVEGGRVRIHDGPGTSEASDHRPVVLTLTWPAENKKGGPGGPP